MTEAEKDQVFAFFTLTVSRYVVVTGDAMTAVDELLVYSIVDAIARRDIDELDDLLDAKGLCPYCGRAPFVCAGQIACAPITLPSQSFLPDDVRETCEAWVERMTAPLAGDS